MSYGISLIRRKNSRVSRICKSCPQNLEKENQVNWNIPVCYVIEGGIRQSLSKPSKSKLDLAEEELLSHIMGNSLSHPLLPKEPVSPMTGFQVWELSHQALVIPMIIALQLHADLQFFLVFPMLHAAIYKHFRSTLSYSWDGPLSTLL